MCHQKQLLGILGLELSTLIASVVIVFSNPPFVVPSPSVALSSSDSPSSSVALFAPSSAPQEPVDRVLIRRSEGREDFWREGLIVDWQGDSLRLESNQRVREIPNDQIIEIQTRWPSRYQQAVSAIEQGRLEEAQRLLVQSIEAESRPWAKQIIRADLVRVSLATGRLELAHSQFKSILTEDPRSRFFRLCPLKWSAEGRYDLNFAVDLIDSDDLLDRLIAASWLLDSPQRAAANKVMEQLASDIDARISRLAAAQLWRLRLMNLNTVNQRQVQVWHRQVEELPQPLRAGPYYFLGDLQSRLGDSDAAALYWMRIPILYPENLSLAAAALYQTSVLMQNNGQLEEAGSLRAELKLKYPESMWAQQL